MDHAVEDRLPVPVAREVVVGHEEAFDAVGRVDLDDPLDVVRRAMARFSALHVDDGAEGALKGAVAPGIEAGRRAGHLADYVGRQERQGRRLQVR